MLKNNIRIIKFYQIIIIQFHNFIVRSDKFEWKEIFKWLTVYWNWNSVCSHNLLDKNVRVIAWSVHITFDEQYAVYDVCTQVISDVHKEVYKIFLFFIYMFCILLSIWLLDTMKTLCTYNIADCQQSVSHYYNYS